MSVDDKIDGLTSVAPAVWVAHWAGRALGDPGATRLERAGGAISSADVAF